MAQYIDKSALVSEIEELDEFWHLSKSPDGQAFIESLLSFLDNIEVKEVDLDWEINLWVKNLHRVPNFEELNKFAKHFFELGLKAQKGE